MSRWRWVLGQLTRRLWLRATLIGALGVLAAVMAAVAEPYVPWELPAGIGADAVDSLLTIIASSMLAVTTFSLSVMTSAYASATNNVTPRATKLVMEDRIAQNVLSTFIGSFLFGIVGIVVLRTGAYGERGRAILFLVTIAVIVLIVVTLLRWIDHLNRLGRVGETTDRVEHAAKRAIEAELEAPCMGGTPWNGPARAGPEGSAPVMADAVGYVQHVDIGALSRCGEGMQGDIYVAARPGTFVYPDTPLAWSDRPGADSDQLDAVRRAFSIGDERSYDQDPRFGIAVLSEVGSRALSPATNDTGTAIDVIGRTTRLLSLWAGGGKGRPAGGIRHPRVHVPPLLAADLFEDAFMLMARDGAGLIEVQLRIRKALLALARIGDDAFRAAALEQARLALERADAGLTLQADRARLRQLQPPGAGTGRSREN